MSQDGTANPFMNRETDGHWEQISGFSLHNLSPKATVLLRLDSFMGEELLDLLEARAGLVCAIGAGGKKSTLYRLAGLHSGRVGLTSTVLIPPFRKDLGARLVIEAEENLLPAVRRAAAEYRLVAYAQPSATRGRYAGVSPVLIREIHRQAGFDATFVKADGARARWIKAPAADEPQIPEDADTVLPVVSARAIGQPLSERIAHRVDIVEAVAGLRRGEILQAVHIARLLASEQGLLKGVGAARVVPVINMVDDPRYEALALETAHAALALTPRFDRVVLASMRRPDAVVRVVYR
jgi:probable selenium-dependent hydroxylase accessory protein YqeC